MARRIVNSIWIAALGLFGLAAAALAAGEKPSGVTDPPEKGFFSKRLDYDGIPIKAHKDVADEALLAGRARLDMMLGKLPAVRKQMRDAGVELHIIGRDQVT